MMFMLCVDFFVSSKITRRNNFARIRASAEELSGPVKQAKPQRYHPSEDISDSEESDENGDAILGPAETSRTVIEVTLQGSYTVFQTHNNCLYTMSTHHISHTYIGMLYIVILKYYN